MELYEKIQALRTARGFTQADLAEKMMVSRQSVQKWESGTTCPDIGKLPELAVILGVTTDALLDPRISREELMASSFNSSVLEGSEAKAGAGQGLYPPHHRRSVLDYLLLLPLGLGLALIVGMFYLFGAMFAGMGFVLSFFCLASGILAVPVIVLNIPNGPGAILIGVAGIFLGFGSCAPVFFFSKWWWAIYRSLARRLTLRLKKIDFRSYL